MVIGLVPSQSIRDLPGAVTALGLYAALDVSLESTSVCIIDREDTVVLKVAFSDDSDVVAKRLASHRLRLAERARSRDGLFERTPKRPHRERESCPGMEFASKTASAHLTGDPRGFEEGSLSSRETDLKAMRTGDGRLTSSLLKAELNRLRRGLLMMLEMIPLATRAQHGHDTPQSLLAKLASPIHDFPAIDLTLATAMFGRKDERHDMPPFFIRQVARIAQFVTIVFWAVFGRPHRRPLLESGRHP
jgi:hypothetical protein